jgi:hypothetical protein
MGQMNTRTLIGAVLTILVGTVALIDAARYPMGTLLRMGPGYFPTVVSVLIIGFGAILLLQAFRPEPAVASGFVVRPVLMIPLGIVLFAVLLHRFGLAPAVLALVIVSSLSEPTFRPARSLALALGMLALIYVVFILILRLPFPLVTW